LYANPSWPSLHGTVTLTLACPKKEKGNKTKKREEEEEKKRCVRLSLSSLEPELVCPCK
jgi:hypothetical protein